jgi:hypothetical protein
MSQLYKKDGFSAVLFVKRLRKIKFLFEVNHVNQRIRRPVHQAAEVPSPDAVSASMIALNHKSRSRMAKVDIFTVYLVGSYKGALLGT